MEWIALYGFMSSKSVLWTFRCLCEICFITEGINVYIFTAEQQWSTVTWRWPPWLIHIAHTIYHSKL
jgi:hypothetical protein